jgi:DNA-binding GntR family transcriptional regulator
VLEVFTLLEGLEHVAARLVAERGDPMHVERLERLTDEMDAALAAGRSEAWAALNTAFHMTIAELPRLPLLREMTERVLDQWHRVRRYYFKGVLAQRLDVAQGEHRAMVAAIKAREIDRLGVLVHAHNRGALAAYMRYLDESAPETGATVTEGSSR